MLNVPARRQYTTHYKRGSDDIKQKVHYTGNNVKAMHISVEESLKKLRTSYIDILYVHWVSIYAFDRLNRVKFHLYAVGLGHLR